MGPGSGTTTLDKVGKETSLRKWYLSQDRNKEDAHHANIKERAFPTEGSGSARALNTHMPLFPLFPFQLITLL